MILHQKSETALLPYCTRESLSFLNKRIQKAPMDLGEMDIKTPRESGLLLRKEEISENEFQEKGFLIFPFKKKKFGEKNFGILMLSFFLLFFLG